MMGWVIFGGIIVASVVIGILAQFVISKIIKRLTRFSRTKIDDVIVDSLGKIIFLWTVLFGIYISFQFFPLGIPRNILKLANSSILVLIIVSFFWIMANVLSTFADEYIHSITEELPTSIVRNLIKLTTITIGVLMALQSVGISIAPILAALGIGGLAVALALQDTLANLFAGIHIILTRQIRKGDYVKLESGDEGFVEDITWRNTVIKTLPNNMVIIPNTKIATSIVTNFNLPHLNLSVPVEVMVSYSSDLEKVERITVEVAREVQRTVKGAKKDFEPFIRYKGFGDSSINLVVTLMAESFVDQFLIKHEFIKRLKKRYDEEGISIPFPQRDVWLKNFPSGGV